MVSGKPLRSIGFAKDDGSGIRQQSGQSVEEGCSARACSSSPALKGARDVRAPEPTARGLWKAPRWDEFLRLAAQQCAGIAAFPCEEVTIDTGPDGEAEVEPLLSEGTFVQYLGPGATVESEEVQPPPRTSQEGEALHVPGPEGSLQVVGSCIPPCEIVARIPETYVAGRRIRVRSPLGQVVSVLPPGGEGCTPGEEVRIRLAPEPEFRVQVPPGLQAGDEMRLQRQDGTEVSVNVPRDLSVGDGFDVLPPAVMVIVPRGVKPGDHIVFQSSPPQDAGCRSGPREQWHRARVPHALQVWEGCCIPVRVRLRG